VQTWRKEQKNSVPHPKNQRPHPFEVLLVADSTEKGQICKNSIFPIFYVGWLPNESITGISILKLIKTCIFSQIGDYQFLAFITVNCNFQMGGASDF